MPYLASVLLYKSLTKIGFTIAAFYVGGYLAALGAYSSTLDYSLAHSASIALCIYIGSVSYYYASLYISVDLLTPPLLSLIHI